MYGFTGPRTPSTPYSLQALNKVSSHCFVGNSSSSIKTTKSPMALSTALFRVIGIFCRGSTQYVTGTDDAATKSDTTDFADSRQSLSATTAEYVNRPPVS